MSTEKISHKEKSYPNEKKSLEKRKSSKAHKECIAETKKELSKIQLDHLKDELWHKVKPWENLWRIIYEHAKKTWKKPIKVSKLENINITPWDKIYFSNDEVIIKYLSWWTKKIPFKKSNNCWNNKKNHPKNKNIPLNLEKNKIKMNGKNKKQENKDTDEQQETTKTIFDKNSPLLWDKIAYRHEIEIRKTYWDKITYIVNKYCKWSLIDESFLYWVFARESRFDKKAVSHTWVKWLWQLTNDTILAIANINEAKARKYPDYSDFYISDEVRIWVKPKNKKDVWHYKVNQVNALKPINQIKLTISYLMYLEDLFSDVKDKNFKTELIITSYNLWPWKTKEIYDNYKWVKNWEWLKKALEIAHNKWEISKEKLKEVLEYVPKVKEYIKLASLLNRKVA